MDKDKLQREEIVKSIAYEVDFYLENYLYSNEHQEEYRKDIKEIILKHLIQ